MLPFLLFLLAVSSTIAQGTPCTYPNAYWPSGAIWNSLNRTLHGRLYRARPPAWPCHQPFFDEALCDVARTNWTRFIVLVLNATVASKLMPIVNSGEPNNLEDTLTEPGRAETAFVILVNQRDRVNKG